MFVVFEGIDGSGKTTVSNRVAEELRRRGIEIDHIREGGEYGSALVERMREFGKDPRNLAMDAMTELLFYVARDSQLLAESIRPALARGGLVFADRYLYSYEVLGHFGRGIERARTRQIIEAVADGLWPDLVVLLDVDPHVARARRKVSKIQRRATGEKVRGGSRKGLGGIGMQHRLCQGYRSIAEREHERWLVIDNADPDNQLDDTVTAVADAIESLQAGKTSREVIAASGFGARTWSRLVSSELAAGKQAFYEFIEARAVAEPAVATYFLSRLDDDESYAWRERLFDAVPSVIAYGLRGLNDERAWQLREKLRDQAPRHVARSLDGVAVRGRACRSNA